MADHALTRRIQQAFDIADLVGEHVKLVRAGKDLKGLCPFHEEKTPSFYVVPAKQIFKCFGCGVGGDVFKFVQLKERVGFAEARAILAARAGIPLQDRSGGHDGDKSDLARLNEWAARWFCRQLADPGRGAAGRRYAESRGLSAETVEAFGIGYAPASWDALLIAGRSAGFTVASLEQAGLVKPREGESGHYDAFRDRLIFPIRDAMNRVIGFGGRALDDSPAKYLNSKQTALFDKGRCLYGIDRAKEPIGAAGRAVVVEGYIDCVLAHQHGLRHTVATLGTALGPDHAALLRRYTESVILLLDSDEAGERAADRALPIFLSQPLDIRLARVPEGKDPADYLLARGREGLEAVLNSAVDALESKWQQLTARYREAPGMVGRRRAVDEFLSIIATASHSGSLDPIQRGLVMNQVANLLGMQPDDVQRQLLRVRQQSGRAAATATTAAPADGPVSVEAVATREILEVLLNEPARYSSVAAMFDPDVFADGPLREVARLVDEACRRGGFEISELLAGIESLDLSRAVVDLQIAGQRRGNFAATIEGASVRIQRERDRRYADSLREVVSGSGAAAELPESEIQSRLEMARQHRHFAGRKHLRREGAAATERAG